jgi:hypothetical protein
MKVYAFRPHREIRAPIPMRSVGLAPISAVIRIRMCALRCCGIFKRDRATTEQMVARVDVPEADAGNSRQKVHGRSVRDGAPEVFAHSARTYYLELE